MKFTSVNAGYGYALRLDRGELVLETLNQFITDQNITGAFFYGLGAVEKASVGYYHLDTKEYLFIDYPDSMEVLSIKGNLGFKDNQPFTHAHVVLSDQNNQTVGGHLQEAIVSGTLELFVHDVQGADMQRSFDEQTGLSLLRINNNN